MSNENPQDTGGANSAWTSDSSSGSGGRTYVESQIIMTTVRVVAPFSFTYGLFMTFHGADSPGGGFQGGAIMAATVLMIAFAFGVVPTREWLRNRTVVALAAGGTAAFALVGLLPVALGGSFLAHEQFKKAFGIKPKLGLEAVEITGVAPIVAGVFVGLFFVLAAGLFREEGSDGRLADGGTAVRQRTQPAQNDAEPPTDSAESSNSDPGDDTADAGAAADNTTESEDSPGTGDLAGGPEGGSGTGGDRA